MILSGFYHRCSIFVIVGSGDKFSTVWRCKGCKISVVLVSTGFTSSCFLFPVGGWSNKFEDWEGGYQFGKGGGGRGIFAGEHQYPILLLTFNMKVCWSYSVVIFSMIFHNFFSLESFSYNLTPNKNQQQLNYIFCITICQFLLPLLSQIS